jgi:hypothetical protein
VEVREALSTSPHFADIQLLLAIPEHQVPLPGGSRPSQNDIWALGRTGETLVSIAVEGKVAEPFGPTLDEWLSEPSTGKTERIDYLCKQLGLNTALPGNIRYQLLHRAASAVIEAKRFFASHAVMLVHSFSQSDEWLQDYADFVSLFGGTATINHVVSAGSPGGVQLHLCWVRGDKRYLTM